MKVIGRVAAVVEQAGMFDGGPRSFCGLVAIRPVGAKPIVHLGTDQFEAATAAVRPMAPAPAVAVFEFVDDDIYDIGGDVLRIVGIDGQFRPREGEALSAVRKVAVEI